MKKYKLSTRISAYIAVILSLAMSGLTIRSMIVKRNAHSVSVTLYGIVFVLLLVVSAVLFTLCFQLESDWKNLTFFDWTFSGSHTTKKSNRLPLESQAVVENNYKKEPSLNVE